MVFVSVGENDRGQVVAVLFEKVEIWYRNIDTVWRFFWETHARIDDDHLIAIADAHAVHPEFADAAERNYLYLFHV